MDITSLKPKNIIQPGTSVEKQMIACIKVLRDIFESQFHTGAKFGIIVTNTTAEGRNFYMGEETNFEVSIKALQKMATGPVKTVL